MVAEIVAGNPPSAEPDEPVIEPLEEPDHRQEKLTRWGTLTVMAALMVGCLIVMAAGLRGYYPIFDTIILELAGLSGLLLFAGSSLLLYASYLPKVPVLEKSSQPKSLFQAEATSKLPPAHSPEAMSSVTEHTTRTLEPALQKKPWNHE